MAELQVVFASNPIKKVEEKRKNGKIKKKENSRMKKRKPSPAQIRARKKFAKMAKARAKAARAKHKKKKNPTKVIAYKRGVKGSGKKVGVFSSKREIASFKKRVGNLKKAYNRGYIRKNSKIGRKVRSGIKEVERRIQSNKGLRTRTLRKAAALRKQGYKIKKVYVAPKSSESKTGKSKKRLSKKRAARKYGKESIVAKRRKKRAKGKKRVTKRRVKRKSSPRKKRRSSRKGNRRVVYLSKKRKSIVIKRKNPSMQAQLQTWTGFDVSEIGALAIGGAIYGSVNSMAAKYLPSVYAQAAKVPVLGTTVVPALIGVAVKWAGKQFKVKAAEIVGEGLIAASVVGMGINASQYVEALSSGSSVSGVDFTPALGGYANSGADFGRDPGNPDFGAVDYTAAIPSGRNAMMNGYPQFSGATPQMGMTPQMGRDPGNPDFGEIPEGLGEIPEGLGLA